MLHMANIKEKGVLSLLKALGSPVRLDILKCLIPGERCVCTIFEQLELRQNLVSHHLAILRNSGLIISRKEGKWVHYSLNSVRFAELKDFIATFCLAKKNKSKY